MILVNMNPCAYYSMAFVCGNPQGYREAVVLKVDTSPGADKQLDLDSSDIIAPTQMLKRLVDHSGRRIAEGRALWRKLRSFTLVPGQHDAPTQASAFNRAVQDAVREAFTAAHRAEHSPSEEPTCSVSEGIAMSSPVTVPTPTSDVSVSSVARKREVAPSRGATCTTDPAYCGMREDSQAIDVDVCHAEASTGSGELGGAQAASGVAVCSTHHQHSEVASPSQGGGHASEASTSIACEELQQAVALGTHNWLE
jgi:hypothetical protein